VLLFYCVNVYRGVAMAATNPAKQRAMRQESLRDLLSKQKHLEKAVDNIVKIEQQGAGMETNELNALKYATEARIKLLGKYLPDLKATEVTGEGGDGLVVSLIKRRFDGVE
jgi:hypothetical protein